MSEINEMKKIDINVLDYRDLQCTVSWSVSNLFYNNLYSGKVMST